MAAIMLGMQRVIMAAAGPHYVVGQPGPGSTEKPMASSTATTSTPAGSESLPTGKEVTVCVHVLPPPMPPPTPTGPRPNQRSDGAAETGAIADAAASETATAGGASSDPPQSQAPSRPLQPSWRRVSSPDLPALANAHRKGGVRRMLGGLRRTNSSNSLSFADDDGSSVVSSSGLSAVSGGLKKVKKLTKKVSLTQSTHKRRDQFGSAHARTPSPTKESTTTNGGAGGEARRRLGPFAAAGASSSPPSTPVPAGDEFRDALSSPWTGIASPSSGDEAPRCIWDVDLTSNTVRERITDHDDDIAGALAAADSPMYAFDAVLGPDSSSSASSQGVFDKSVKPAVTTALDGTEGLVLLFGNSRGPRSTAGCAGADASATVTLAPPPPPSPVFGGPLGEDGSGNHGENNQDDATTTDNRNDNPGLALLAIRECLLRMEAEIGRRRYRLWVRLLDSDGREAPAGVKEVTDMTEEGIGAELAAMRQSLQSDDGSDGGNNGNRSAAAFKLDVKSRAADRGNRQKRTASLLVVDLNAGSSGDVIVPALEGALDDLAEHHRRSSARAAAGGLAAAPSDDSDDYSVGLASLGGSTLHSTLGSLSPTTASPEKPVEDDEFRGLVGHPLYSSSRLMWMLQSRLFGEDHPCRICAVGTVSSSAEDAEGSRETLRVAERLRTVLGGKKSPTAATADSSALEGGVSAQRALEQVPEGEGDAATAASDAVVAMPPAQVPPEADNGAAAEVTEVATVPSAFLQQVATTSSSVLVGQEEREERSETRDHEDDGENDDDDDAVEELRRQLNKVAAREKQELAMVATAPSRDDRDEGEEPVSKKSQDEEEVGGDKVTQARLRYEAEIALSSNRAANNDEEEEKEAEITQREKRNEAEERRRLKYESEIASLLRRIEESETDVDSRLRTFEEEAQAHRDENARLRADIAAARNGSGDAAPFEETKTDGPGSIPVSTAATQVQRPATRRASAPNNLEEERQKLRDAVKYVEQVIQSVVTASAAAELQAEEKPLRLGMTLSIPSSPDPVPLPKLNPAASLESEAQEDEEGRMGAAPVKALFSGAGSIAGSGPASAVGTSYSATTATGGDYHDLDLDDEGSWAPAGATQELCDNASVSSFQTGVSEGSQSWAPAGNTRELCDAASVSSFQTGVSEGSQSWAPAGATRELCDDASVSSFQTGVSEGSRSWAPAGATRELCDASVSSFQTGASGADEDNKTISTFATANASVFGMQSVATEGSWNMAGEMRSLYDGEDGTVGDDAGATNNVKVGAASHVPPTVVDGGDNGNNADDDLLDNDDHDNENDDDASLMSGAEWMPAGATGDLFDDDSTIASGASFRSAVSALTDPSSGGFMHHPPSGGIGVGASLAGTKKTSPTSNVSSQVVWELYRIQGLLRGVLEEQGMAMTSAEQ